jgi:hypothetical protein
MDYIFDILVDPVENELYPINKENQPFPDMFRQYLFGMKNLIIDDNAEKMAQLTGTEIKYWHKNYDLYGELLLLINKYLKLPKHYLTDFICNKIILPEKIIGYYKKIYNIVDIIIAKSYFPLDVEINSLLFNTIHRLVNYNHNKENHIYYRIIIYQSVYLIKILCGKKSMTRFIQTIIEKLQEFIVEPEIWKYFTNEELNYYTQYVKKLNSKHTKIMKHK